MGLMVFKHWFIDCLVLAYSSKALPKNIFESTFFSGLGILLFL